MARMFGGADPASFVVDGPFLDDKLVDKVQDFGLQRTGWE
jgi:hypothetical protein